MISMADIDGELKKLLLDGMRGINAGRTVEKHILGQLVDLGWVESVPHRWSLTELGKTYLSHGY
jgi:ribosomal protein S19E (S16A)